MKNPTKYGLLVITVYLGVCCASPERKSGDLRLELVERIIIDTPNNLALAFVVKITNKSTQDLALANRYIFDTESTELNGLSCIDTKDSTSTLILGSILHSKYYVVPGKSKRHVMFVLSRDAIDLNKYMKIKNEYLKLFGPTWPFVYVKNLSFTYNSKFSNSDKAQISGQYRKINLIDSIIQVPTKDTTIKYFSTLLSEEAGKIIIRLDSLSNTN